MVGARALDSRTPPHLHRAIAGLKRPDDLANRVPGCRETVMECNSMNASSWKHLIEFKAVTHTHQFLGRASCPCVPRRQLAHPPINNAIHMYHVQT
jgi:hypothetical protein